MKSNIKKIVTKSNLTVAKIEASDFQKEGTLSATLRQKVTTVSIYPSKKIENSLQGNVFDLDDFGFGDGTEYTSHEDRVAFVDVPSTYTLEQVQAQFAKFPDGCLYRILSSAPILSDSDENAIDNDSFTVTLDTYADRQALRYPKGSPEEGKLILDDLGQVQYRKVFFSNIAKDDIDERGSMVKDPYISPDLEDEMSGKVKVVAEQVV